MLSQLRVRSLGVIAELDVSFGSGMIAITGETGAGKTLVVEAVELVCGGRADATMVRAGDNEAVVEAVFVDETSEHLVTRVIPRTGRSRSSIDGDLATLGMLEAFGSEHVDLHGQHAHQSLLRPAVQRGTLDQFAGVDLGPIEALRAKRREIDESLVRLGGDDVTRARELDLLSFEIGEIDSAMIVGDDEDDLLAEQESMLASILALRDAEASASESLSGGTSLGATDLVGQSIAALSGLAHFDALVARLHDVQADLLDVASELRRAGEALEEDPARLSAVRERRELLHRLIRKHGASLSDVTRFVQNARARLDELSNADAERQVLMAERERIQTDLQVAEKIVGDTRRGAADALGEAVVSHLGRLALSRARFSVAVDNSPLGDEVTFLFSANAGEPQLALAKIASGGELARTMLALRLVLSAGPATLVFDEVDAGIGGEAALAVGAALSDLGRDHQVFVVTHLAQVAAFADAQIVVEKDDRDGRTVTRVATASGDERVIEIARMLSGQPNSQSALGHAADLLESVAAAKKS